MARKKKSTPIGPKMASESASITMRSCTINLSINMDSKKLNVAVEDRSTGQIFDAEADLEVRE